MNLNQPTLTKFEESRKISNYVPPMGSNSFYNIGNGTINILTKRDDLNNYRFKLFTDSGEIEIGDKPFSIVGDIDNIEYPYESMTIIENTSIVLSNILNVYNSEVESYGTIEMKSNSYLNIKNNGSVILYKNSDIIIEDNIHIKIDPACSLVIYGNIHINLNSVPILMNTPGIRIDSAAVMHIKGLESLGIRLFSLTDYYTELSNQIININTNGEKNFIMGIGRIGYSWTDGNPLKRYQILKLSVLYGNAILGDFKLSILGLPEEPMTDIQIIDSLIIENDTTLHITDKYHDYQYAYPELYIGKIIGNCKVPGKCIVKGKINVSGSNSRIVIDRESLLIIEEDGEIELNNLSIIKSTYNKNTEVLFINGKLVIDDINQINTFSKENIVFGDKGKLIIRNPDTGIRRILFSTPNGIYNTELYRLFGDRLEHVEYHISNNTGIKIDQYYEFYAREFTSWYNDIRIEKAIHDGLIVWHDGGFVQLDKAVIPWVNKECNLLHASRLFKTFGSFDYDRLQEAANRLKFAGCGNILFIFSYDNESHEIMLILDGISMKNIINNPNSDSYNLLTDNTGDLFMRNNLPIVSPETIITKKSTKIEISDKTTEFILK